jgi:hypothetical protein
MQKDKMYREEEQGPKMSSAPMPMKPGMAKPMKPGMTKPMRPGMPGIRDKMYRPGVDGPKVAAVSRMRKMKNK